MSIASAADFVACLEQHALLEPAQFDEVRRDLLQRLPEPRALAGELIRRGWLTPYQVNSLFRQGTDLALGPYLLLEKLGEGGMGQVFKARHRKLGKVVALKVVRPDLVAGEQYVRRFDREIRAAAQLAHDHVVHALDAGQECGRLFYVMEYVEGATLKNLVSRHGPLPVPTACDYVRQAALGLQHAHERGLVHRDVKPSNLLVTPDGVVKVLDMGLARLETWSGREDSSALTHDGTVMGTFDYIAPEQADDAHRADVRADLYSLGCTLYYLLTGRVPFPGGSYMDKVERHRAAVPLPVERLRPDVPPAVAAVVRRLMAKRPEDRYQTPAELARALADVDPGAALPAADLPAPVNDFADLTPGDTNLLAHVGPPRPKRPRRRRLPAVLTCAAVVLGLAAGVFLLARPRRPASGEGTPPTRPVPNREQLADRALQELSARFPPGSGGREELWADLVELRRTWPGTPAALAAGRKLTELPSPLDRLDKARIPAESRFAGMPNEVVAVLGSAAGRHWSEVLAVAFRGGGEVVAADQAGYSIWDAQTLRETGSGRVHSAFAPVTWAAISADGRQGFFGNGGKDRLYLASLGGSAEPRSVAAESGCLCGALSADGTLAAAGAGPDIRLWDVQTGRERPRLRGKQKSVLLCLALSPDGRRLLAGGEDGVLRLWDVEAAVPRELSSGGGPVTCVAFSGDGRRAVSGGGDKLVRVWDVATAREVRLLRGHTEPITSLALSPDGRRLLSGSNDRTLRLWDVENAGELRQLNMHAYAVAGVAFSPDGSRAVSGGAEGGVHVWDLRQEAIPDLRPQGQQGPVSVAFSPDGGALLTASINHRVHAWDVTGAVPREIGAAPGYRATWHPEGRRFVTGDDGGELGQWDLPADGTVRRRGEPFGYPSAMYALAYSPDGRLLATGDSDHQVHLWDAAAPATPRELGRQHGPVHFALFSPDGRSLLTANHPATIRVWDMEAPDTPPREFRVGEHNDLTCLALSPDGRTLAVGGLYHIALWDWRAPQPASRMRLAVQTAQGVTALAYAPAAGLLAWSNNEGHVIVWDLASARFAHGCKFPGRVTSLAFAPDSRHLAVGNANGTACILRIPR